MVRKNNRRRHMLAALISLLILLLGLSLGLLIDNERVKFVQQEAKAQEANLRSIQFQYLYLSSIESSPEACNVLKVALDKSVQDLGKTLSLIEKQDEGLTINKDQFKLLQRRYLNDNLQYWLLTEKTKKMCNLDVNVVLYFFSGDNCSTCPDQGVILTYFKKKLHEKLLIFPIDVDLASEEPIITILLSQYNISTYPSIVVGGKTFSGVISRDEFSRIIGNEK